MMPIFWHIVLYSCIKNILKWNCSIFLCTFSSYIFRPNHMHRLFVYLFGITVNHTKTYELIAMPLELLTLVGSCNREPRSPRRRGSFGGQCGHSSKLVDHLFMFISMLESALFSGCVNVLRPVLHHYERCHVMFQHIRVEWLVFSWSRLTAGCWVAVQLINASHVSLSKLVKDCPVTCSVPLAHACCILLWLTVCLVLVLHNLMWVLKLVVFGFTTWVVERRGLHYRQIT